MVSRNRALAGNPDTPVPVLKEIADDEDWKTRLVLAWNSALPAETLTKLANDPVEQVQSAALSNPNTPAEVLIDKAKTVDLGSPVQLGILENPKAPGEVVSYLMYNGDKTIARFAARHANATAEALTDITANSRDIYFLSSIAENNVAPVAVLRELFKKAPPVRDPGAVSLLRNLAKNCTTPLDVLYGLLEDEEAAVRTYLASNTRLPLRMLVKLMTDEDAGVRDEATTFFNDLPTEVYEKAFANDATSLAYGMPASWTLKLIQNGTLDWETVTEMTVYGEFRAE